MPQPHSPNWITLVISRAAAVVALSAVLGFAFNSSNPVGIRLHDTPETQNKPAALAKAPTAPPPTLAVTPTPTPAPIAIPPIAPQPSASTLPTAPAVTPAPAPIVSTPPPPATVTGPSPTTWAAVKPKLEADKLILVDARAKGAYDSGHIPGAISLPESSSPEDLAKFKAQFGADAHVVVYCSSTSCSLSFKLAYKLAKDHDFTNVQYMTGGYMEYQREMGLNPSPATAPTPAAPPPPSNLQPSVVTSVKVHTPSQSVVPASIANPNPLPPTTNPQPTSWAKVDELLSSPKTVLVDIRPPDDYRTSHFAGALSLPATASAERIAEFIKPHAPDVTFIVYGDFSGSAKTFQFARQLLQARNGSGVRFVVDGYNDRKASPSSTSGK